MPQSFDNFKYDELSHLQVGEIAEYWVKIWLTLGAFDIYTTEVDDQGIDFIIRLDDGKHIDVQVKSVRKGTNYAFVAKESWKNKLRENLYLALVIFENDKMPMIYFIPSTVWLAANEVFKDRPYGKDGQKSKPEWGINISAKNMHILEQYDIMKVIEEIKAAHP